MTNLEQQQQVVTAIVKILKTRFGNLTVEEVMKLAHQIAFEIHVILTPGDITGGLSVIVDPRTIWECGCGAWSGVNLDRCGRCGYTRIDRGVS